MIFVKQLDNNNIDGMHYIDNLDVEYSGSKLENGIVNIKDNRILSAKLCVDNYSIDFDGKKSNISSSDYCKNSANKTLTIVNIDNENEKSYNVNKEYELTIPFDDSINFMMCENGVMSTIENDAIKLSEILSDTTCYISANHINLLNKLNEKKLNITLFSDYVLNEAMVFPKNSNIIFNLENVVLDTSGKSFKTFGNLTINSKEESKIIGVGQALNNSGSGTVVINGGYYERNSGTGTTIYNEGSGTIIINSATIVNLSSGNAIQNRLTSSTSKGLIIINEAFVKTGGVSISNNYGDIEINGGIYISDNKVSIANYNGNIVINANKNRMYVLSNSQSWYAAISNYGNDNISINAKKANDCTNDYNNTTTGLCVFAEGNGEATSSTGNGAIQNVSSGTININGGTYFGLNTSVNNNSSGTINLQNVELKSGQNAVFNNKDGIINILNSNIISSNYSIVNSTAGNINLCSSHIYSGLNRDLINGNNGTVNYSSNTIFSDLTNNPTIVRNDGIINSNYEGNCFSN